MDSKGLITFCIVTLLIFIGWEQIFPTPKPQPAAQQSQQQQNTVAAAADAALTATVPVKVTTDTVQAVIDEKTGDLRKLSLLKYNSATDESKDFILLDDQKSHLYIAQSDLLDANGQSLTKNLSYTAAQKEYSLNGDTLEVRLSAPANNGVQIDKVYTFTKNSYLINVRFDVTNQSGQPVKMDAAYRMVRDHSKPEGEGFFMHSYTGPVV